MKQRQQYEHPLKVGHRTLHADVILCGLHAEMSFSTKSASIYTASYVEGSALLAYYYVVYCSASLGEPHILTSWEKHFL